MGRGFVTMDPHMASWPAATPQEQAQLYAVLEEDGSTRMRAYAQPVLVRVVSWPSATHAYVRETVGQPIKAYTIPRSRLSPVSG
jgi:hypothetical protein